MNQCFLPFVQEQRGRSMQTLQVHQAVANAAFADDIVDAVGDIEQLQAVVRYSVDDPAENPVSGPRRCLHRRGRFWWDDVYRYTHWAPFRFLDDVRHRPRFRKNPR